MTKLRAPLPPAFFEIFESSEKRPAHLRYMPQLDALRAFAVLAVMFQNYYGSRMGFDLPIGEWGVQLFFVLSGFLITGILLNCRSNSENSLTDNRKSQIKQFYIRRALRILPLFYLVVLGAALVNIRPLRESLFWHLTYTSNFMLALRGGWDGPASHFWSLAVEEQFYLFWPFLILWLPAKHLKLSILAVIAAAPLFKIVGYAMGVGPIPLHVLTLAYLDALGIGALLALFRHRRPQAFEDATRDERYNGFGLAMLFVALLSCLFWESHYYIQVAGTLSATLLFAWLIHRAAVGFGGAPGRLMRWKPLLYIGQISYGLYIFHKFMSIIVPRAFGALHLPYPNEPVSQALLLVAINILVASCSWFLFERPINNLKKRFKYENA